MSGTSRATSSASSRQAESWFGSMRSRENKLHNGFRSSPAGQGSDCGRGRREWHVYAFDAEQEAYAGPSTTGSTCSRRRPSRTAWSFIGDIGGTMFALELQSGRLSWQFHSGSPIYGNAAVADNTIFFGNLAGSFIALRADSGAELWRSNLASPINTGPAVAGDYLYIGTLKKLLFAIRRNDGIVAWSQELEGRIKTSPAAVNGQLLVATDDWVVLSFHGERAMKRMLALNIVLLWSGYGPGAGASSLRQRGSTRNDRSTHVQTDVDSALVFVDSVNMGHDPPHSQEYAARFPPLRSFIRTVTNWLTGSIIDTIRRCIPARRRALRFAFGRRYLILSIPSGADVFIGDSSGGPTPLLLSIQGPDSLRSIALASPATTRRWWTFLMPARPGNGHSSEALGSGPGRKGDDRDLNWPKT